MKFLSHRDLQSFIRMICVFVVSCCISHQMVSQTITDSEKKVLLIYKFAENIQWPNENELPEFTIGIYTDDNAFKQEFEILEAVELRKKPLKVVHFNGQDLLEKLQVIVIGIDKNRDIASIANKVDGKNLLLVTDNCEEKNHIMINFIASGKKLDFEVNKGNILKQGLKIMPDLLLLGGTEIDVSELYKESQKTLNQVNEKVKKLMGDLLTKQAEIQKRNQEILHQKEELELQKSQIEEQKMEITDQLVSIAHHKEVLEINTKKLGEQQQLLLEKNKELELKEDKIQESELTLKNLNDDIKRKQDEILHQKSEISTFETRVEKQKGVILISVSFSVLILILVFIIYRGLLIKKRTANQLLESQEELRSKGEQLVETNKTLEQQKEKLAQTLVDLRNTQAQLVQSEKLASLGVLTAGIAHEINNPLNFINAGIHSLQKNIDEFTQIIECSDKIDINNPNELLQEIENLKSKLDYEFLVSETYELIDGILVGSNRVNAIVKSLRTFSRLDEDSLKFVDIHEGIDSTLMMLQNVMKENVKIKKNYGDIPKIECYPGKINQVFINILTNACEAIENEGIIDISSSLEHEKLPNYTKKQQVVVISMKDNGRGISKKIQSKLFEPFFTTKEVGKGTGLGLSISHGIISKHNGIIQIVSEEGTFTKVTIKLPVKQNLGPYHK